MNDKIIVMEFGAEWCGACESQKKIMEKIASEYGDIVEVRNINIDNNPELASEYMIRSIPTTIIFKDDKMVEYIVGLQSKESLKERIIHWI